MVAVVAFLSLLFETEGGLCVRIYECNKTRSGNGELLNFVFRFSFIFFSGFWVFSQAGLVLGLDW